MAAPSLSVLLIAVIAPLQTSSAAPAATPPALSRSEPSPGETAAAEPTLVVLLAVDQMRADYFDRFGDRFIGGLRTFLEEGAVFTNAHQDHAITATAAGHASMLSGLYPRDHGIADNHWYDLELQRDESAGVDPDHRVVGLDETGDTGGPAGSPWQFRGTTLVDWLHERDSRSRSVSISRKDRAAVLMTPTAQHAYWFHWSGRFVTSTYYREELPVWVRAFNDTDWLGAYAGESWPLLAAEELYEGTRPDDYVAEANMRSFGRGFPHKLPEDRKALGDQIVWTPYMDAAVLDLAQLAITNVGLGQVDGVTDVLALGLSSTDAVGHAFGPFSVEIQEQLMRLDLGLSSFLYFVDEVVGLDRTLLVLTSDHGVAPLPEHSRDQGLEAERIDVGRIINGLEQYLSSRFGGERWVSAHSYLWFNINRQVASRLGVEHAFAVAAAKEYLQSLDEVAVVFTRFELLAERESYTELEVRVRNSFVPSRSGDLFLVHHPFSIWQSGAAANHQSPYYYDSHVPLILLGPGVRPGRYQGRVGIVDLAPTLAALLSVSPPAGLEGRILLEAVAQ